MDSKVLGFRSIHVEFLVRDQVVGGELKELCPIWDMG